MINTDSMTGSISTTPTAPNSNWVAAAMAWMNATLQVLLDQSFKDAVLDSIKDIRKSARVVDLIRGNSQYLPSFPNEERVTLLVVVRRSREAMLETIDFNRVLRLAMSQVRADPCKTPIDSL